MNNITTNPKTLARLWAALSCDFEKLIAKFMVTKGWRYIHFAAICREMQITLVLHITQGKGKTRDEHYQRITHMIFQVCKDIWLNPIQIKDKTDLESSMQLKRALGGFFLIYTMYERQPFKGRVKISLGLSDMIAFHGFNQSIKKLPYYSETAFMLEKLHSSHAFYYCIFSEEYRFEAITRNMLNISQSDVVGLTKRLRQVQDVLAYSSINTAAEEHLADLSTAKNKVAKDMLKTLDENGLRQHCNGVSMFRFFVKAFTGGKFLHKAMTKLDNMLDKPIVTLETLTATEAVERRMMMETRLRMQRALKKAASLGTEAEQKVKNVRPYVREGGIFGRKKETPEEGEEHQIRTRRERNTSSGNLWVYINNLEFDKPFPGQSEEVQPETEEQDEPMETEEVQVENENDEDASDVMELCDLGITKKSALPKIEVEIMKEEEEFDELEGEAVEISELSAAEVEEMLKEGVL